MLNADDRIMKVLLIQLELKLEGASSSGSSIKDFTLIPLSFEITIAYNDT